MFQGEFFSPHILFISFPDPSLPADGSWVYVGVLCTRVFLRLIRLPNGMEEVSIWYGPWFCRAHYCAFCRCVACCERYALERPAGDICHWLHHTCMKPGASVGACLECLGQETDVAAGQNPYTGAAVRRQMERVRKEYGTLEQYTGRQIEVAPSPYRLLLVLLTCPYLSFLLPSPPSFPRLPPHLATGAAAGWGRSSSTSGFEYIGELLPHSAAPREE